MKQTLTEMVWPQPPTPIQTDNTTSEGVVKKNCHQKIEIYGPETALVTLSGSTKTISILLGKRTQELG